MNYKILSIDTSSETCSASLYINGDIQSEFSAKPQAHSELILQMCDQLLKAADLTPAQLDGIAFSRGPGSFTGVRIGAGVTQGIAFAADIPVVPVSTLAALAFRTHRLHGHPFVLCALDARIQEVYWGAYEIRNQQAILHGSEVVCGPKVAMLPMDAPWVAAGKGWQVYEQELAEHFSDSHLEASYPDLGPHAEDIALLSVHAFENNLTCPAEQAVPIYLRDNVAKKSQPKA